MNCEKIESVTSHNLYPPLPPVTNCHTFSDPPPLERDILYGRPLICYDMNSCTAPLRRLYERRITSTSFNSIQYNSIQSINVIINRATIYNSIIISL